MRVSLLKRRRIAVRWSAPEVLIGRSQTPASNVWSYGVLAWEVMSLGQLPYHLWNDDQVAAAVTSGAVLSCPSVCIVTLLHDSLHCAVGFEHALRKAGIGSYVGLFLGRRGGVKVCAGSTEGVNASEISKIIFCDHCAQRDKLRN